MKVDDPGAATDKDVIYVGMCEGLAPHQSMIHQPLESGGHPMQAEGHPLKLEKAPRCCESSFLPVLQAYQHLPIPLCEICSR